MGQFSNMWGLAPRPTSKQKGPDPSGEYMRRERVDGEAETRHIRRCAAGKDKAESKGREVDGVALFGDKITPTDRRVVGESRFKVRQVGRQPKSTMTRVASGECERRLYQCLQPSIPSPLFFSLQIPPHSSLPHAGHVRYRNPAAEAVQPIHRKWRHNSRRRRCRLYRHCW
jgi:hypothetical protein